MTIVNQWLCALAVVISVLATPTNAQTRKEVEIVGIAFILDQCPLTPTDELDADGKARRVEAALIGTLLAGVAGDIAAAGLNALGASLEEASREKGFSAVATTSFPFYQVNVPIGSSDAKLDPRLKSGSSLCLVSAASSPRPKGGGTPLTQKDFTAAGLNSDGMITWNSWNIPADPDLYMEIALQLREDGFVARPALIWYRRPIAKAPNRAMAAEVHAAFSTPASPSGETNATFALARIRLPEIAPRQQPWTATDLQPYVSLVLPRRPTSGSPETVKASLSADLANAKANRDEIQSIQRALARARKAASEATPTKEDKNRMAALEDTLSDAQARTGALKEKEEKAKASGTVNTGSTNVQVRFTVVRDANQFGMAVAKALQGRAKGFGDAVTERLTPATRADSWTAADTGFVTAMSTVDTAQHTLDGAIAKGDPDAIFSAQVALRNAKAAANAAAAASDRTLPFPNLL